MPISNMPEAEVEVSAELVIELLREQWPGWSSQPVEVWSHGWDNVMLGVGNDLFARFPRRALAAPLVINEARWLPVVATDLPIPVPTPVFSGQPGNGYPWTWNLVPRLSGFAVGVTSGLELEKVAVQLGVFLRALHRPGSRYAPDNPFRGGPLAEWDQRVRTRADLLAENYDRTRLLDVWERVGSADSYRGSPLWIHGDLHPLNMLAMNGQLSGIVDFGDITAGDPAVDLSSIWMTAPDQVDVFRDAYGEFAPDLWARARGWALHLSLAYISNSADNPAMAAIGDNTLRAVLSDRDD